MFGPLRYLATGPALDARERASGFRLRGSGVSYRGSPRVAVPVIPVLAWGAAYDLDIVLVSDHPSWDMHELARLPGPDGPTWVVKEARRGTLEQVVTVDLPDADQWFPELPVARHAAPVEVLERATDRVDLCVRWTTPDGEAAVAEVQGPLPRAAGQRNGPTLGHSRDQLLAVLDVSARAPLRRASLTVGGRDRAIARIAGVIPFRFSLVQAQGGLATGAWETRPAAAGLQTAHAMRSGARVLQDWTLEDDGLALVQRGRGRTLCYRFRAAGAARELVEIRVLQGDQVVTQVVFSPALPDLAFRFEGVARSRWVIDLNGQPGHAVGEVAVTSRGERAWVDVAPRAPAWVRDRPLQTEVRFDGGVTTSRTTRSP